jgi:hypothetical protein
MDFFKHHSDFLPSYIWAFAWQVFKIYKFRYLVVRWLLYSVKSKYKFVIFKWFKTVWMSNGSKQSGCQMVVFSDTIWNPWLKVWILNGWLHNLETVTLTSLDHFTTKRLLIWVFRCSLYNFKKALSNPWKTAFSTFHLPPK